MSEGGPAARSSQVQGQCKGEGEGCKGWRVRVGVRSEVTSSVHTISLMLGFNEHSINTLPIGVKCVACPCTVHHTLCFFLFFLSCHPLSTTSFRCTPHPPLPFSPTSTYTILPHSSLLCRMYPCRTWPQCWPEQATWRMPQN